MCVCVCVCCEGEGVWSEDPEDPPVECSDCVSPAKLPFSVKISLQPTATTIAGLL